MGLRLRRWRLVQEEISCIDTVNPAGCQKGQHRRSVLNVHLSYALCYKKNLFTAATTSAGNFVTLCINMAKCGPGHTFYIEN